MFWSIIKNSFLNQKKAMAVMLLSTAVGSAVAASLLTLSLDISTKVSKELRSYGANIIARPKVTGGALLAGQRRYLRQEDLVRSKTIFWRHNIVSIAPMLLDWDDKSGIPVLGTWYRHELSVPGEKNPFTAGMVTVMPWWEIEGRWPSTDGEILAGAGLAKTRGYAVGDSIPVRGRQFRISGIVTAGGKEDDMLVGELATIQKLTGLEGKVSQVLVSALTTPMDDFAYREPETMTKPEYEKWYCTGYVTSIAKQLETEAFRGSTVRPIWPVAEAEGRILNRLQLLIVLLAFLVLTSAALGISTTMINSVLRRADEVALMKAVGADTVQIITLFLAEAVIIGLAGGVTGYVLSLGISDYLGNAVFGSALQQRTALFPISLLVSILTVLLAVYLPIGRALRIKPAIVLKGGQ